LSPRDKPRADPSTFRKILLIRLRRIGDIVLTTPAVRALKLALPQAELSYVVEEPYRRLVEGNPDLAEIIVVPKAQTGRDFAALVRRVRKAAFDAVLDFHSGPRASLLSLLSGAKIKIGYRIKYRGFIYDVRIPRRPDGVRVHSVENHVNLVRALGVPVTDVPELVVPEARPEEAATVSRFLGENGLTAGVEGLPIVLHIGAGTKFREWGAENMAGLVGLLEKRPGVRVILIGGQEDRTIEAAVLERAPGTLSLVGQINLAETRELIARAALFAGPDSGPMHIAAATGTPIVAWFGPNVTAHVAPWKPRAEARIIEKDLDCRPCKQRECVHGDVRCIQTITPEEVFEACDAIMGGSQGAS
jgi:lipopolysaccharide heptosyltransferase II